MSSRIASAITKCVTSSACSANSTAVRSKNSRDRLQRVLCRLAVQALARPASFWAFGRRPKTTLASETVGCVPPRP